MSVVKFYPKNAADNPDNVLEQAVGEYSEVLIIGWDKGGFLDVRSNKGLQAKDCLWLIEQFKMKLIRGDYSDE